jgi:peptidoglycan/xylan/chitin deacetylase (PgdA/CDA1 family)
MEENKYFKIGGIVFAVILILSISAFLCFKYRKGLSATHIASISLTPAPSLPPSPSLSPSPSVKGLATNMAESSVPILMYHHIKNTQKTDSKVEEGLSLTPDKFNEEMEYLASENYRVINLDEIFFESKDEEIVITFDDGYKDVVENAYPALKRYGYKATVFLITKNIAKPGYLDWNDIKTLQEDGWQFGSHTISHLELPKLTPEQQKKEIVGSKKILETTLDTEIKYFCYPAGKYDQKTVEIVKSAGYVVAVTTNAGTKNSYKKYLELNRVRIIGGLGLSGFKSAIK